jgi:hypothetical protein
MSAKGQALWRSLMIILYLHSVKVKKESIMHRVINYSVDEVVTVAKNHSSNNVPRAML